MLFKNLFRKFNSRLVKLLRERIVNLQSGKNYLFQIRNCKIPKNKKRRKNINIVLYILNLGLRKQRGK